MKLAEFTLHAGWHARHACPVQTELSLDDAPDLTRLRLWNKTSNQETAVQAWSAGAGKVRLAWVLDALEAQQTCRYELSLSDHAPSSGTSAQLQEAGPGKLDILINDTRFTTYHYGQDVIRPYLYPVFSADGTGITRDWPMREDAPGDTQDHVHHRGIWTAHGEVDNGQDVVNNWTETEGHGWQLHREFSRQFEGPICAGFTQLLDWTDGAKQPVMSETRRMAFYSTAGDVRIFDYEVRLHASETAITLRDTKEAGLLSVRVASSMDAKNQTGGTIVNGYGAIQEDETWGKRAPWCDYSGPVQGREHGIALFDHPDNPRYPSHWHVRNYGLMTANCFGLHDFTRDPENRWDFVIPAGESRTWQYRVLIHPGDAQQAQVADHYHDYINPPQVDGLV